MRFPTILGASSALRKKTALIITGSDFRTASKKTSDQSFQESYDAMRILLHILLSYILIHGGGTCIGEEEPKTQVIACGPFPFHVSPAYPFVVYNYGKQGVRLIERPLTQTTPRVELILGCSGASASERIIATEPGHSDRERQLDVAETTRLTERLFTVLEKLHGMQMLEKLKANLASGEDLTWILMKDDSGDLIATVMILDAVRAMKENKKAEQADAGESAAAPQSRPSGNSTPNPESKPRPQ